MKLQGALVGLVTLGLVITHVQANATDSAFLPSHGQFLADAEKLNLFDDLDIGKQVVILSPDEMRTTEGAFGPFGALVGGLGSFGNYAFDTLISESKWSWAGAASATVTGATMGAFASPVAAIWGANVLTTGGIVSGIGKHYGW